MRSLSQTIVSAVSLDLKPHSLPLASKTVDDALNRLRDVGLAWQPAERSWAIADPLLSRLRPRTRSAMGVEAPLLRSRCLDA